jgi:hypothetical protein
VVGMSRCAFCKAQEGESYEYGVPVCRDCLDIVSAKAEGWEEKCAHRGLDHNLRLRIAPIDLKRSK